ncbi:MAG: hypothetical protein WC512_01000, partial [Candidatus Omnitrophota bacterium]
MAGKGLTIWIEEVCLSCITGVFVSSLSGDTVTVKYLKGRPGAVLFLGLLLRFSGRKAVLEKSDPYLGDMPCGGSTLGMKFQFDLPELSKEIAAGMRRSGPYAGIIGMLPSENLDLFTEMKVSEEIFYGLKLMLMAGSEQSSGKGGRNILFLRSSKTGKALACAAAKRGISARFYGCLFDLRFFVVTVLKCAAKGLTFFKDLSVNEGFAAGQGPLVAVHYAEGLDTRKRSDIFWIKGSGIDPARILVYIDTSKSSKAPVEKSDCGYIRGLGASWVSLNDAAISREVPRTRIGGLRPKAGIWKFIAAGSGADLWYLATALSLYTEAAAWEAFYRKFNIKAVIDIGAQTSSGIAQNAALKRLGGVKFGAQRSSLSFDYCLPFLVYNSNDVFFIWGELTSTHRGTSSLIKEFVVSGYPFDNAFSHAKIESKELAKNHGQGKFTIALFDNVYSKELHYSAVMIKEFYGKFLDWLLKDEGIVVIAKEKKAGYLDRIGGLGPKLREAAATGRFVRFEDPLGKLPVTASEGADISVGVGISSAVIEAAIAGGRAVHCDIAGHGFHPYYKWGKDELIFDDIDRLITALKGYRDSGKGSSDIGNWSRYLDRMDPYRDGQAGKRAGNYIRFVLDALGNGDSREGAID